jgi:hypothetical protein
VAVVGVSGRISEGWDAIGWWSRSREANGDTLMPSRRGHADLLVFKERRGDFPWCWLVAIRDELKTL